jgi:hypothetical protein
MWASRLLKFQLLPEDLRYDTCIASIVWFSRVGWKIHSDYFPEDLQK